MRKITAIFIVAAVFCLPCFCSCSFAPAPYAAAEDYEITETVKLPIVMYHDIMKSRKGRYIVSPAQLESDVSAILEAGYTFVAPREVIAYAEGRRALPSKPIMLTFDDGHYNNAFYGLPVFEKYDAKATFFIVGEYADRYSEIVKSERDNPNYSCLTWDEVSELSASRLVSIGSHSFNMHEVGRRKGITRMNGESEADYVAALSADTRKLQYRMETFAGGGSEIYAYPFGLYSELSQKTLEGLGYKMFFTCNEHVSTIRYGDPDSIKELGRFNREGNYSTAKLLKLLGRE